MGAVVEACNGVVDKFTGDGFLAHFGIINSEIDHALEACYCAIRMRNALTKINSTRYLVDQPVVMMGIGINTGLVAAGTISTMRKAEYTVLGSTVNLASRIEGLTKEFGVDCLVSDQTYSLVEEKLLFQQMPARVLRGISDPIKIHWLLPMNNWP